MKTIKQLNKQFTAIRRRKGPDMAAVLSMNLPNHERRAYAVLLKLNDKYGFDQWWNGIIPKFQNSIARELAELCR